MSVIQRHRKLAVVMFVGVILFAVASWFIWQPAVSFSKLNQLSVGMTTNQVQRFVGMPLLSDKNAGGKTSKDFFWYYENFHWRVVYVHFDENGAYKNYSISSTRL